MRAMLRSGSVLVPTSDVTIQRFTDHVRGSANVRCLDLTPISSLSRESQALLLRLTTESIPGAKRLKGELPAGTVVAHKNGTGGTQNGITSATNDIGIIILPDGRHLAVAAFVSDSSADEATRESVIARVAKAAWDWASSAQQSATK